MYGGSVECLRNPKGAGELGNHSTSVKSSSNRNVAPAAVRRKYVPRPRLSKQREPLMRVALFTECYRPIVNGIVASIDALRDGLRARGVGVTTVAPHFPGADDARDDVVRIPSLPLPTPTEYRLCVPFLRADDRRKLHGIDVVHAHSPFVTGWMAASYAHKHRVPLVFTYHTRLDAYAHYAPFDRAMTERAMIELTRRYANRADAVVVPTRAMEVRLRELGVRSRIAVVPSAIDVPVFAAGRRNALLRARLGARDDAPLVLVVSRLGAEKNVELAIDALALVPDAVLAVVGDGPHRGALEERARRLGVAARVRFAGTIARERLPDVYASADVLLFPSTTETQGLVLIEALAAGLPVVAADSPASRDVLGKAGRIVAPEPAAAAAGVRAVLIGGCDESAVHLALSGSTVEEHARLILELYREVLAARAA